MPPTLDAAALERLLGPGVVSSDPADLAPRLVDERRLYRGTAGVLVRPRTVDQVVALLTHCDRERIGVVPQGGNTGYCGAATPFSTGQVLLSLDRLDRVRAVDAENYSITLEAGVVLAAAHAAAAEVGLQLPLTLGSEGSAMVGGLIATNAGGSNVVRYGMTRDLVLGLEAVLPGGRVISRARGLRKDNTGLRIADLLIGSEGTLGVITAATLKLSPPLAGRATALAVVPSVEGAGRLLRHFRDRCDDNLVAFELVTQTSAELSREPLASHGLAAAPQGAAWVLVETAADAADRADELLAAAFGAALAEGRVIDGVVARSSEQRSALWRFRESIPDGERMAGGSIKHDVSVPVHRIPEFLAMVDDALAAVPEARRSVFGHIGDGNLHYNVLAPEGVDPADWKQVHQAAITEAVLTAAEAVGGSFSAEHGIGVLKREELRRWRTPDELELMRQVKAVFDPNGIMNPGKVL